MEEYSSESLTAKQMMYYIELYGISDRGRRAKAQHLGAWALDCMWAEVRARINRVDAVSMRKLITDNKLEAVLNKEYAKLRPQTPIHGVGDDEDFGNIFESAGTISILMRDLRIIRRILIAMIEKLPDAEAERFWQWEPGFGYQQNGRITSEAQTITFRTAVATSPMEVNTPRMHYGNMQDTPAGGARRLGATPKSRAFSVGSGSMNKPRSPMPPPRTGTRSSSSRQARTAERGESQGSMPSTGGLPTELGPGSSERSRSARRQKPEAPEGGDDREEHAFVDDIDFTAEDVVPEVIPEAEEEEGFRDDDEDIRYEYVERIDAEEIRVRVEYEKISTGDVRPKPLTKQPHWWPRLDSYQPVGGITREMCKNGKTWKTMENGVRDAGFVGMTVPMTYEVAPNKGRNIAHDVRRGAILEVIREIGYDNFLVAIDDKTKSGEQVGWEDPGGEEAAPIRMEEPEFEVRLNHYVKIRLPIVYIVTLRGWCGDTRTRLRKPYKGQGYKRRSKMPSGRTTRHTP
eukprot:3922624-Amphidinium_carterae.2